LHDGVAGHGRRRPGRGVGTAAGGFDAQRRRVRRRGGGRGRVGSDQLLLHRPEIAGKSMAALEVLDEWPVPEAAAAVIAPTGVLATHGDTDRVFALASVTKPLVARAVQVAVEEGVVELDN